MLIPAMRYKDILLKKFSEVQYSNDYFLCTMGMIWTVIT